MLLGASIPSDIFRALLQGLPPGAVYALVAIGFALTYKTSGVFNFAFGAQAYVSAAMFFKMRLVWGWPIVPSVFLAVFVLAPAIGLVLERLIFRNLRTTAALPKLVLTIGLSVAIPNLFDLLAKYEIQPGLTPEGIVNNGNNVFYKPVGFYSFNRNELVAMGVALVATLALAALFKFTALGLRMRAVVESSRLTELNGVAADRVSAFSWALSSLFAGMAGVLIAPRFQTLSSADFFNLMVVAIAAAAIGRLVSLPLALAGGLGLGFFIAELNTFLPRWSESETWLQPIQRNLTPAIPFVVLFLVLVLMPAIRRSRETGDPLAGVDPPPGTSAGFRPDPKRVLYGRIGMTIALVAIGTVVLTRADQAWLFLVTQAVLMAVIFLSITVITGMAGEISLCQGAFAAIGGFTVFQLSYEHSMPPLLAIVFGMVIAAIAGAVLSLPVRRLGGVWTAIATLAFAYFFDAVIVNMSWVSGGVSILQNTIAPRPKLGPIDFSSDKNFLVLSLIVLALTALIVAALQSGTFGKTLAAVRGSEVAAQSIGISPARGRMLAFAISGGIAALGGGLLASQQQNVNYPTNFPPFAALFWVVVVVVLGVRSVKGALWAGAAFSLFDPVLLKGALFGWILRTPEPLTSIFPLSSSWLFILFGLGAIQFAKHPEGALEDAQRKRAEKYQKRLEAAAAHAAASAKTDGEGDSVNATSTTSS
jgi:branched-subunit amino acid ABC-type transport system permease component